MSHEKPVRLILIALFCATGISGLGYQVLWAKRFAAGVGHEFPAVLAVVSAVMGGIAVGAAGFSRIPALRRSNRAYGILELVIGVWAAATVFLIPLVNRWMTGVLGATPSASFHWMVVFGFVFLTLLPATAAMGATFPAVEQFLAGRAERRGVAILYAANTAGAMMGVLASAFWLMPRFGISASIWLFAGLNIGCGLIALAVVRREATVSIERRAGRDVWLALRLLATGFLGIGFETVMIRGLSQVLENTVFTYAALLATYLGGTAAGAAIYARRKLPTPWLIAALGLSSCAAGLILRGVPVAYPFLRATLGDSLAAVAAAEVMVTALTLLAPTVAMGATFAALAEKSLKIKPNVGWSLAWNTFGASIAPAAFGLLLLPKAGTNGALGLITAGYFALLGRSKLWFAAIPAALVFPLLPGSSDLLRLRDGDKIVFHREGPMASTVVVESTSGARVLKVNNRFQMGGTAARIAEERHAYLPLLLHPEPRRALFIGLGTGISFGAARHFPGLRAEGVELLPEVVAATPLFDEEGRSLAERGLTTHVADGRRFVVASRSHYDVVVSDLFHPAADGAGFLYTREHFSAIRARLNRGGVFCQWLPLFQLDLETFRVITRTMLEVFPDVEAWLLRFNVDTPVIGLISGGRGTALPADGQLRDRLRRAGITDELRLLGCHLANPKALSEFASGAALNTDDSPVVMFRAPRLGYQTRDNPGRRLLSLIGTFDAQDVPVWIQEPIQAARLGKFKAARDLYLRGLAAEWSGDLHRAISFLAASAAESADFTASYAHGLTLAAALAQSKPQLAYKMLYDLAEARPELPVARQLLERLERGE